MSSNFLGGSLLKDDIHSAIDYAKATSYAIKISSSYGKISPKGVDKYKVGDYVSINFNSDSDYQFIRWVVKLMVN